MAAINDELVTLQEAEQTLKRRVSTLRTDIRKGRIPGVKLGRLMRIRRSDLNALVERGLQNSTNTEKR